MRIERNRAAFVLAAVSIVTAVGGRIAVGAEPATRADSAPPELDPALAYRADRSDPVTHTVDFSVVVAPPYKCKVLKVWVPIPQSDFGQEVSGSRFTTFPLEVEPQIASEPIYGNRFAYFEFQQPAGAQIIRHRFQAKVWNLNWGVDPQRIAAVEQWPEAFQPYLRTTRMEAGEQFTRVLAQITAKPGDARGRLFGAMEWIDANLTYDHVHASLQADPNHAFNERRGHCSDYHGLCAVMGRSLGYPTRVTYGLSLFPKNSPSHCKLEAFLPPYGWVSFDISETQKLVQKIRQDEKLTADEKEQFAAAARQRLQQGFRENSWLLLTRGTDYEVVPKAARPVRVVRTAYVDADGEALPEPDPANAEKREFSWMTAHRYEADREFARPFEDVSTLRPVARHK
jgi:transglutaminase-like putative cysteine protease